MSHVIVDRDQLEQVQQTMIFTSGVLLGFSLKDGVDPVVRELQEHTARSLAWQATELAIALGHTSFLIWRYS